MTSCSALPSARRNAALLGSSCHGTLDRVGERLSGLGDVGPRRSRLPRDRRPRASRRLVSLLPRSRRASSSRHAQRRPADEAAARPELRRDGRQALRDSRCHARDSPRKSGDQRFELGARLVPAALVPAFAVEIEPPVRQRSHESREQVCVEPLGKRARVCEERASGGSLSGVASSRLSAPFRTRVTSGRENSLASDGLSAMTTSASRPMRSNNAATAALRAGISSAQSSAQSKTFLALLRRETAGHCHGVVATTTASGRSHARKTLRRRSTDSAICGTRPRYGGISVVRSMTSMAPRISAMLSAAAGESAMSTLRCPAHEATARRAAAR